MSTNNINEAEREAFEAWAISEGFDVAKWEDGTYCSDLQRYWQGWQARAALSSTPSNMTKGEGETIPVPTSTNMARAMVALGCGWLKEHAPEHLRVGSEKAQAGEDA